MVIDTQEELDTSEQLDDRGREHVALTDLQFAGGQGVPDCLDNMVLLYLTQHLTSTRFDNVVARSGVRRYIPHLCFIWQEKLIGISTAGANDSAAFTRVLELRNAWVPMSNLNPEEAALYSLLRDETESIAASLEEESRATRRSNERWATILRIELGDPRLNPIRREQVEVELRELAKVHAAAPIAREIKVERRWLLDRNHPEVYQQNHRKLFGKVPSWVFYKTYNELRRLKAKSDGAALVEDPYAGGRPSLLTSADPPGMIRITSLDEFGLATLAEYRCAREGYDYGQVWQWYLAARRKAFQRNLGGLAVDRWIERNTFWITPSCQSEFTSTLARRLRGEDLNVPESVQMMDTPFGRVTHRDLRTAARPEKVADRLCAATDSFSHVLKRYQFSDGRIDWSSSDVVYPTVEELRDMVRDNENFGQTRSNASAYDAGLLDYQRVGRAKDAGVGGRRSASLWWHDPKFRLLWGLLFKSVPSPSIGSPVWDRRFNPAEMAIDDMSQRIAAHDERFMSLLGAASVVVEPHHDKRPSDSATFARLLALKATITAGSSKIVEASRKATSGDGYPRGELNDDLGRIQGFTSESTEYDALGLELAWFIDPREVMRSHQGLWSWYIAANQTIQTNFVDPEIEARRPNFLRHEEFLRAVFQLQWRGPFTENMEHIARQLDTDRVVDTLSPLTHFYNEYPAASLVMKSNWDGSHLEPVTFSGSQLRSRDDLEEVVTRYRRKAVGSMRRRAAEMTYMNESRSFTPAVFARWRENGFPWRIGDNGLSEWLLGEMAKQSWLNGIYDTLMGAAETTATTGVNLKDDPRWLESQISARKLNAFYASGKWIGGHGFAKMYWDGKPITDVLFYWVAEWISGFVYPDNPKIDPGLSNCLKLADLIVARNAEGALLSNWDEVERVAMAMITVGIATDEWSLRDRERLDAVKEVWATIRNRPLWQ